jgi:hypothetical protein
MWGFKILRNRQLAKEIFNKMVNKQDAINYNRDFENEKGNDQTFLDHHVYEFLRLNSTIHDSYLCKSYRGSSPWPSKRQGNCYVGVTDECDANDSRFWKCPSECRPKKHENWIAC